MSACEGNTDKQRSWEMKILLFLVAFYWFWKLIISALYGCSLSSSFSFSPFSSLFSVHVSSIQLTHSTHWTHTHARTHIYINIHIHTSFLSISNSQSTSSTYTFSAHRELAAVVGHETSFGHDGDEGQTVAEATIVVVLVVPGRNLHCPCTKAHFYKAICHHHKRTVQEEGKEELSNGDSKMTKQIQR